MVDVNCNEKCSRNYRYDTLETWRWIKHVLPQLRGKQVVNVFFSLVEDIVKMVIDYRTGASKLFHQYPN